MTQFRALGCVFITIFFTVYAQLIIKWKVLTHHNDFDDMNKTFHFYFSLLTDPWILSTILTTAIAGIAWMAAMSKLPLNITYPITSLTFPLVLIFSKYFFAEPLNLQQLISIALIMAGVVLLKV